VQGFWAGKQRGAGWDRGKVLLLVAVLLAPVEGLQPGVSHSPQAFPGN